MLRLILLIPFLLFGKYEGCFTTYGNTPPAIKTGNNTTVYIFTDDEGIVYTLDQNTVTIKYSEDNDTKVYLITCDNIEEINTFIIPKGL